MNARELCALSGQGSVIVIRRAFVDWLGTPQRAMMLDHLLYLSDRASGELVAITDAEWQERFYMSRREVQDSRAYLVEAGLLEIVRAGMPARQHYRVLQEEAAAQFSEHLAGPQCDQSGNTGQCDQSGQTSPTKVVRLTTIKAVKDLHPPPPAPAKPARAARSHRPRNRLFDAFVEVWGYDPDRPAPRICGLGGDFASRVEKRCGVEAGLLLWREWVALQKASRMKDGSPVWGNLTTTHNATTRFLGWVDTKVPSQETLEPWYFIDPSGRKSLRSPALAISELGLSADPYRPETWPPEMHAAYAERLVVMDGSEVFM